MRIPYLEQEPQISTVGLGLNSNIVVSVRNNRVKPGRFSDDVMQMQLKILANPVRRVEKHRASSKYETSNAISMPSNEDSFLKIAHS